MGEDPSVNRLQERVAELLRKGGGAVRAERHDGQPGRAQGSDPAGRRHHRRRRGAYHLARIGRRGGHSGVQLRSSPVAASSPPPSSAPPTRHRATSSSRRPPWSPSRTRITAAGGVVFRKARPRRSAPRRARSASPAISTAHGSSTRRRPATLAGAARGALRPRLVALSKGLAARSAASSPGARATSRGRCGRGACSGARCGSPGSSRRPGSTPSTTTWRASRGPCQCPHHRRASRRDSAACARPATVAEQHRHLPHRGRRA